ncbi:kanadaptin [Planococcus citri]|uniref:kanadaptin n=1 Tax=Planococcus citri TaxID=170843 RepID=UPI0031FA19F6
MEDIKKTDDDVFKKPSFLPVAGASKVTSSENHDSVPEKKEPDQEPPPKEECEPPKEPKEPCTSKSSLPIPYTEPSWGGRPDILYSLEEMKAGVSLRTITLDQRSFYCFGRMENCHIVMAHPTVSRYHAVLQYRSTFSESDENRGFYIFDLGSTHGTFLNKSRIKPKIYVKVQVGHIIKFGSSTRFFLLQGPDEDQEEESKLSYSELKELRDKEIERRQAAFLEDQAKLQKELEEREKEEESRGIDWGMGEDADEETDLTENPFAITTNEELYIDDPKKVLRNWFEREGEELRYNVNEKGFGKFHCSIELPIENSNGTEMVAEVTVSGKKKEAVHQCALEACRMLDRAGLLKQSNQESRKKKLKNWEEDDYYDSDEDSFFDRTGDLEVKRKQRMNQVHKTQPATDTYETLMEKHKNVLQEIENVEKKLQIMDSLKRSNDSEDALESYMSTINSGNVDKLEMRRYKNILINLKKDEDRLRKLINFVKPLQLPEPVPLPEYKPMPQPQPQPNDGENSTTEVEPAEKSEPESLPQSQPSKKEIPKQIDEEKTQEERPAPKKKPEEFISPAQLKRKLLESSKPSQPKKQTKFVNKLQEDFNNIEWAPPTNQTGDGRTSLNDKYGY